MSWQDHVETTHQSHELRLSTPDDWRLRGLVGAFWEDFDIKDDMNFLYKTIPSCTPANLALYAGGYTGVRRQRDSRSRVRGDRSDRAQRQCRVRRGPRARLQADRVLHLDRLRPDPEGADADRRDALLPLQGDLQGLAVLYEHRMRGYPERPMRGLRAHRRDSRCDLQRVQEPRQSDLARHAGRDGLLHVLAGLPPGRRQPQEQRRGQDRRGSQNATGD